MEDSLRAGAFPGVCPVPRCGSDSVQDMQPGLCVLPVGLETDKTIIRQEYALNRALFVCKSVREWVFADLEHHGRERTGCILCEP
jgi:hypothetical protein